MKREYFCFSGWKRGQDGSVTYIQTPAEICFYTKRWGLSCCCNPAARIQTGMRTVLPIYDNDEEIILYITASATQSDPVRKVKSTGLGFFQKVLGLYTRTHAHTQTHTHTHTHIGEAGNDDCFMFQHAQWVHLSLSATRWQRWMIWPHTGKWQDLTYVTQ